MAFSVCDFFQCDDSIVLCFKKCGLKDDFGINSGMIVDHPKF